MPPNLRAHFESLSPEDRIRKLFTAIEPDNESFTSKFMLSQVSLRSVTPTGPGLANVVFAFPVEKYYCNNSNTMHGGFQATAFDNLTSLAIMCNATPGSTWLDAGVSRVLTVNYLRPAMEGEVLLCECEVVQVGKRMAMTRGVLRREKDGKVVSTCEHNKSAVEGGKPGWMSEGSKL